MKVKFKQLVMVGIVAALGALSTFGQLAYADSNSMTVTPNYQKMILTPGETYHGTLRVSNSVNSTRDLKYAVKVGSFSQSRTEESKDDYGSISHINVTSYNQIMDWIKLDTEGGTLAPGEATNVTYSIEVPEDAPGGGQYATILLVDETTSGLGGEGNITIDQTFQFASIIYAEVTGTTREKGDIVENSIPSFLFDGPLQATAMVKNNGNVHTDASYTLQVWPIFSDEEICTNDEKPETSLILPDTERYHAQTCDLPMVGIFKAKQVVKIFNEVSEVERTIIVCPLWLLAIIILVIMMIVVYFVVRVKSRKRRAE